MADVIGWYPGHMAKARRMLAEQLAVIDAVVELTDARLPEGARNPDLQSLVQNKPRLLVLNKADLADPKATEAWIARYAAAGEKAVGFTANARGGVPGLVGRMEALVADKVARKREAGMRMTVRVMIVGIPNVGKSTLINALRGSAAARAADRPGVTRGKQWVSVKPYLDLLDTPGLLWPKLQDQRAALRLCFLGSIRDEIADQEQLAVQLLEELQRAAPDSAAARLNLPALQGSGEEILSAACLSRGWLMSGGRPDTLRGAQIVLDEFRGGRMGRITLERP